MLSQTPRQMKYIDLTVDLNEQTPVYPGDPAIPV